MRSPKDQAQIIGELKEFKRATLSELREIKGDIKSLKKFRWMSAGRNALAIFLISLFTSIASIYLSR